MQSSVFDPILRFVEQIFAYDIGTPGFNVTLGVIKYGEGQVEQREERVNKDLDAIL